MALPKSPITETMSVSESRKQYSEILNRVFKDDERVVIEKNGIPIAAIVPMSVVRDATFTEQRRAELRAAFRATREEFRGIPPEEIEREIERAIVEVEESRRDGEVSSGAQP
ncbi:MAG: type II toxin-antitoxin system Phd/YefM family antitoxin [Thermomicrobiales bacterium]